MCIISLGFRDEPETIIVFVVVFVVVILKKIKKLSIKYNLKMSMVNMSKSDFDSANAG